MTGNRKKQSAAIRFGPALKAAFLCLVIGGSALGYVWQKSQIYQLGEHIRRQEKDLKQIRADNQRLRDQLAVSNSPVMLDQFARSLKLGLLPAQPNQVWQLPEPVASAAGGNLTRQLATRHAGAATE